MGPIEKTVIFLRPAMQKDLKTKMLCSHSSAELTRQKKIIKRNLTFQEVKALV